MPATHTRKAKIIFSTNRAKAPSSSDPDCISTTVPTTLVVLPGTEITWTLVPDDANGDPPPTSATIDNSTVTLQFTPKQGTSSSVVPTTTNVGTKKIKATINSAAPKSGLKMQVFLNSQLVEDPDIDIDPNCGGCGPGQGGISQGPLAARKRAGRARKKSRQTRKSAKRR